MSDTLDSGTDSGIALDTDYDCVADTALVDTDHDGVADSVVYFDAYTGAVDIVSDTDGDGWYDTEVLDLDGDGSADMTLLDFDEDGSFDEVIVGEEPALTDDPAAFDDFEAETDPSDTPDPSSEDSIHGDPMAEIEYHQAQQGIVDCVPTSIAMVLSEMTGETVPASTVVAAAHEMGVMTESGMYPEDAVDLLSEFGVDAAVETGTIEDLTAAMDAGEEVVVGLDAADLYYSGGGPFDPGLEMGHAVVITGIDTEAGVVYVNDPGFTDGAGLAIPVEEFLDGWADADNVMIVVEDSADGSAATTGTEQETTEPNNRIVLPITFTVDP